MIEFAKHLNLPAGLLQVNHNFSWISATEVTIFHTNYDKCLKLSFITYGQDAMYMIQYLLTYNSRNRVSTKYLKTGLAFVNSKAL